ELLDFLPDAADYVGIDISRDYVVRARERGGPRAQFRVGDATAIDPDLRGFDLVLAFGVLHHLDDLQGRRLFESAAAALRAGGRTVTVDPTLTRGQSWAARAVISRDRGRYVRTPEEYLALVPAAYEA